MAAAHLGDEASRGSCARKRGIGAGQVHRGTSRAPAPRARRSPPAPRGRRAASSSRERRAPPLHLVAGEDLDGGGPDLAARSPGAWGRPPVMGTWAPERGGSRAHGDPALAHAQEEPAALLLERARAGSGAGRARAGRAKSPPRTRHSKRPVSRFMPSASSPTASTVPSSSTTGRGPARRRAPGSPPRTPAPPPPPACAARPPRRSRPPPRARGALEVPEAGGMDDGARPRATSRPGTPGALRGSRRREARTDYSRPAARARGAAPVGYDALL